MSFPCSNLSSEKLLSEGERRSKVLSPSMASPSKERVGAEARRLLSMVVLPVPVRVELPLIGERARWEVDAGGGGPWQCEPGYR